MFKKPDQNCRVLSSSYLNSSGFVINKEWPLAHKDTFNKNDGVEKNAGEKNTEIGNSYNNLN